MASGSSGPSGWDGADAALRAAAVAAYLHLLSNPNLPKVLLEAGPPA
jgi:hypothetical protein